MKPLHEIEDLAESIAGQYLQDGKVDLENIAHDINVPIIYGNYGECFLGNIVHEYDEFFIYLNLDKLPDITAPRSRFTIAHDLGHYFIDYHRNILKAGNSLSFSSTELFNTKPRHEIEADHFAAHLLMPKKLFMDLAKDQSPGYDAILYLKNYFNTSIECTAIHYVKLNVLPCMFIKWKKDISNQYIFYSDSLAKATGLMKKPTIQFQKENIQRAFMEIEFSDPQIDYIETATLLSKWVATIAPGSAQDLVGLEQTFKHGEYGGMTFLLF